MKQLAEASGPSFGLAVLIPASLLLLVVAVLAASRIESRAGRFLFAALWARMLLGAFHVYMFKPLFAGFSGNALVSIAVVGIGLLIIRVRHLMLAALLPAYLLMLIILPCRRPRCLQGRAVHAMWKSRSPQVRSP
jgi:hypothetical protein